MVAIYLCTCISCWCVHIFYFVRYTGFRYYMLFSECLGVQRGIGLVYFFVVFSILIAFMAPDSGISEIYEAFE